MLAAVDADPHPAIWPATVTSIERRGPRVAIVHVAPDTSYPYRAGQHATLTSDISPRSWRVYSIANPPADGDPLELHLAAVERDGVTAQLIAALTPTMRITLGPALGTTTLTSTDRPIVGIAGGTGFAPLKALTRSALESTNRRISLHVGGRTATDLYDHAWLADTSKHPRVTVTTAVSQPGAAAAMVGARTGRILDIFLAETTATELIESDIYLAGSPAMMAATLSGLLDRGVPLDQIHYDVTGL